MKKTLLALSLASIVFIGCGGQKITDDMAKTYENNLNNSLQIALSQIPAQEGIDVKFNNFKCVNKKELINCTSDSFKILGRGQEFVSVDKIIIDTNEFYNGKATGVISIKDMYKDMLFDKTYSNVKFQGIKISDAIKGMAALIAMQDEKLSILNTLANGIYDLDINSNILKDGNVNGNFVLTNTSNKDLISFAIDAKLLDKIYDLCDKAGIKYDVAKQDITEPDEKVLENLNVTPDDVAKSFQINNVKIDVAIQDLFALKQAMNDEFNKLPDTVKDNFKDIVDEILNNKPHKLSVDVKIKEGFDYISNANNDKAMLENILIKINGKDINARMNAIVNKAQ